LRRNATAMTLLFCRGCRARANDLGDVSAITVSPLLFEYTDEHGAVRQDLRDESGEADRICHQLGIQHGDVVRLLEDARGESIHDQIDT